MRVHHLIAAALFASAFVAAPSSAQSLALTYSLDRTSDSHDTSVANDGCASFRWVAAVAPCKQQTTMGRYSPAAPGSADASGKDAAGVHRAAEGESIPFLGERPRDPARRVSGADDASRADFNLRLGNDARSQASDGPRDQQIRFRDLAQELRTQRSAINALGLQVVLPISERQSLPNLPAVPE